MAIGKPRSPGDCLRILNENMKTDILRHVHEQMHARNTQKDKKSPLKMLIDSIEQVLAIFGTMNLVKSISRNPFNIYSHHNFNPEVAYKHDIDLLKSQLRYLREILADLDDMDMTKSVMDVSVEQIQIALQIDARVKELEKLGCNEVEILTEMVPFMPNFKKLLDTVGHKGMDELCERFEGFYHYARLLEHLAGGIRSGEIKVPKTPNS